MYSSPTRCDLTPNRCSAVAAGTVVTATLNSSSRRGRSRSSLSSRLLAATEMVGLEKVNTYSLLGACKSWLANCVGLLLNGVLILQCRFRVLKEDTRVCFTVLREHRHFSASLSSSCGGYQRLEGVRLLSRPMRCNVCSLTVVRLREPVVSADMR